MSIRNPALWRHITISRVRKVLHLLLTGNYDELLRIEKSISRNLKELKVASSKVKMLEKKYPNITKPEAIDNLMSLEHKLEPINFKVNDTSYDRYSVFLPHLDPMIIFGGYTSIINLIRRLVERGKDVRIVLTESVDFDKELLLQHYKMNTPLHTALSKCEYVNASDKKTEVEFFRNENIIAYSFWTAKIASDVANQLSKDYIYFIQEDESIFHCWDSAHVIALSVYNGKHKAVFNTECLQDYFIANSKGVFAAGIDEGKAKSMSFEHALTKIHSRSVDEMRTETKKVLVYARPESHAKRNLFEIAMIALRTASKKGVFRDSPYKWEFTGVGTLGREFILEIGEDEEIHLKSKLSESNYIDEIKQYDLGISLMHAPHPSLLPFEMAQAGMLTVTNVHVNRNKEWFESKSGNIYACGLDIDSIVGGIEKAVGNIDRYDARFTNSNVKWPNNWDQVFSDDFMKEFEGLANV